MFTDATHAPRPTILAGQRGSAYTNIASQVLELMSWDIILKLHSAFEVASVTTEPMTTPEVTYKLTILTARPNESRNSSWMCNHFRLYLAARTGRDDGNAPSLQLLAKLEKVVIDLQDNAVPVYVPPGRFHSLQSMLNSDQVARVGLLATQLQLMMIGHLVQ